MTAAALANEKHTVRPERRDDNLLPDSPHRAVRAISSGPHFPGAALAGRRCWAAPRELRAVWKPFSRKAVASCWESKGPDYPHQKTRYPGKLFPRAGVLGIIPHATGAMHTLYVCAHGGVIYI